MPNRVLLVEGQDDTHVVRRIIGNPSIEVIDTEGIDNLLRRIPLEVAASGRLVVGIVVDADDDPGQRWRQLRDRLSESNVDLPQHPEPVGAIVQGNPDGASRRPRIGVWLMPDNGSPGELEDFIEKMIPPADPVWPRSQRYIDDIPAAQRKFKEGKLLRAQVHSWLATREIPGRMGAAIGAGDLLTDGELAQRFVGWLRRLFE